MKRLALLAVLAGCGSPATVASVVPSVPVPQPVQVPAVVSGTPVAVAPAPAVVQVPTHVKVVIPASTGYVIAPDQRFVKDVVPNQPILVNATCNPDQPFPYYREYITKGDGLYLDMMSCKKVGLDVVNEWFYAWNKVAAANPSFTPKQIQDAISAGAY